MRSNSGVVSVCLLASLLSACGFGGLSDKPGTTQGEVLISGVAVGTRERLISDRRDQYAWLQQQLKEADNAEFGVNGERTRRSAVGATLNATANVAPADAALYAAGIASQLAQVKRDSQLQDLNHQIALQKRALILKNGTTETDPEKIAVPAAIPATPGSATSPVPAALAATAPKDTSDALKTVMDNLAGALAPTTSGTIVASPLDRFRDKLAYREEIRNEMIAFGLDDRHDMRGNALYRISLDATVVPGNDSGDWAVISVCVQRPRDTRCSDGTGATTKFDAADGAALKRALLADFQAQKARLFNDLTLRINSPNKTVALETLSRRSKALILNGARQVLATEPFLHGGSAEFEKIRGIMQLIADGAKPLSDVSLEGLTKQVPIFCQQVKGQGFAVAAAPVYVNGALLKSACVAEEKDAALLLLQYFGLVGLVFDTKDMLYRQSDGSQPESTYFGAARLSISDPTYPIIFNDNQLTLGIDLVKMIDEGLGRKALEIYAYGATPKESVQRIADVASRREGLQLALGLQALAGNVGVSTLTNFMQVNEGVFNALKRQPLVVGFGHSNANVSNRTNAADGEISRADFGWIIGPRFGSTADGKQANFRHEVKQNGLSAVVSIPGWWDKAELVINRYWVDGTGKFPTASAAGPRGKLSQIRYSITVPSSSDDALGILTGDSLMRVQLERPDEAAWQVRIGSPAEIIIRGKNLWRNPQVRLGSQFASDVKIMPDMEGVVAIFDKVVESYGSALNIDGRTAPANTTPVTIATPAGMELVGYAKLLKEAATPTKLAVEGGAVVIGEVKSGLKLNLPLAGYYDIGARYREAGTSAKFREAKSARIARPKPTQLTFEVPKLAPLAAGAPIELQLLLTYAKGDEPEHLAVTGPLIYYPTRADWKVKVAAITALAADPKDKPDSKDQAYTVRLKFPPGYEKALGIKNGAAAFTVEQHSDLGKLECTIKKDLCDLRLNLPGGLRAAGLSLSPVGLDDDIINPVDNPLKAPK